ncbi:MAG TPA: glycogen debranching N-terminal domain-containing protein [Jiangellaceae bacterium]
MAQPWAPDTAPARHGAGTVTLVEGSTFCLSAGDGDIVAGRPHGLFVRDTRVISRWELAINGAMPEPLTMRTDEPFAGTFLGHVVGPAGPATSDLLIVRRRYVGDGMREDITLRNVTARETTCVLTLTIDADFADLFEVKEERVSAPEGVHRAVSDSAMQITRRRRHHRLGMTIRADANPEITDSILRWQLHLPAHAEWTVSVEAVPSVDDIAISLRHPRGRPVEHAMPARKLREWRRQSPQVSTGDRTLAEVLQRSVEDLGALRIFDPEHPERPVVAAGAPWFMALFGRDSLLTSWMLLPLDTELAVGTLQTLAAHQGQAVDPATEEEPGKILHETRFGPEATFALGGRNVYYGTADATPLFVMLLGELRRWGADDAAVRALLPHADRALEWIEKFGDDDGDGFVEYSRSTGQGLVNQGWKDSWDGITFADGRIPHPPIALAEVQGYAYAAYVARSHFATEEGDDATARHWSDKARRLKEAFNEAFWLADRGWYALGLDGDKRPIDALASNMGHCLWTGIVDEDKAESVADHLLSDEMFSGWGIRTLASSMAAYNPMSYHNGSVWPHDNALCVAGLMRYGFVAHAQRVVEAQFAAAESFGYRLPEVFCGFARADYGAPIPYPTACSPQAWASAAPLLLMRSMLRLDPAVPSGRLWCAPEVPARYLPLHVGGLEIGRWQLTIDLADGATKIGGTGARALEVVHQPRPPTIR